MRRATGWEPGWFRVGVFRVITDDDSPTTTAGEAPDGVITEATIKVLDRRGAACSRPPRATVR